MTRTMKAGVTDATTLVQFIEKFGEFSSKSNDLKCYRGQRDYSWKSVPGILRADYHELLECENRAVRDLMSVHPGEFLSDQTMFDKLVRMQHFGLPTRLLDVSSNALVALFFATEENPPGQAPTDGAVIGYSVPLGREKYFDSDSVSCLSNLSNLTYREKQEVSQLLHAAKGGKLGEIDVDEFNDNEALKRLAQFIRVEKSYFLSRIKPIDLLKPYFVHPKLSNPRILAQAGAFIIHGIPALKRIHYKEEIVQVKFRVPSGVKIKIRSDLEGVGITESSLFPEIEKAAARIKRKYVRRKKAAVMSV